MRILTRAEWNAALPKEPPIPMRLPVARVYLHHSVSPVTEDPRADMKTLQKIGFNRGFNDISYSYAFHPDGTILAGRGTNVGAHTEGKNSTSFGFVLIGDYSSRVVTNEQVAAIRWMISHMVEVGHLSPGTYPTAGHRELKPTVCPGDWAMQRLADMRVPWTEETPVSDPNPEIPKASAPVVNLVPTPSGEGYWIVCADGGVYSFGDANYYGRVIAPAE